MQFDENKIFEYIEEHKQEYIDLIARLCAQPSLAGTGEGIDEMVEIVIKEFEDAGLDVKKCTTPGNPVLVATKSGESDKVIGFYDHYDVQPVDPLNEWESEPFTLTVRDGKMFARGVSDNKGGLAASLAAVDAYMKVYGKLPCGVKFLTEGEEEIGSPNLEYFCNTYRDDIDCSGIIFEGGHRGANGKMDLTFGVKGLLYVELRSRNAQLDAHSSLAAIVDNPAWRLVKALATLKDEHNKIMIDGFYDGIKPLTQDDIDVFKYDGFSEEGMKNYLGIKGFINGMTGEELLRNYHYVPTCNIAGLVSGYTAEGVKTVLPGNATCKIDFRLVPGQDPEHILELLKAHLVKHGFEDIEVVRLGAEPAYRSDPNSDFCVSVKTVAERFTKQAPAISYQTAGTCPLAYFCEEKNIPAAMAGCGSSNNNVHAPNEFYVISDYIDDIKYRAALMNELGK